MAKTSNAILLGTYKYVTSRLNLTGYNRYISSFMEVRADKLYDIVPCDRIYFGDEDYKNYFTSTNLDEATITQTLSSAYFWSVPNFNPKAAKDPLTVAQMCVIRDFLMKGKQKEAELAGVYLAFSGKFYPSIHYGSYPKTPPTQYRYVMEYVVNNMMNEKFDIKSEGSVIGAVKKTVVTWMNGYKDKFKKFDDGDVVYLIQQLHSRIKSFTINIAKLYYQAYERKEHLSYAQDSISTDDENNTNTSLTDNDSLLAERIVQKTMEHINIKGVDYKICMDASDYNVRVNEIKGIIESILTNPNEQKTIKEFIGLLVTCYFQVDPEKNINNIKFISYSIAPKPNSKNPYHIRSSEIVEYWLSEKSPAYRKRSKRPETKASYFRSIYAYFTLTIYEANK